MIYLSLKLLVLAHWVMLLSSLVMSEELVPQLRYEMTSLYRVLCKVSLA